MDFNSISKQYSNIEFEFIHRPDNPGYGAGHNIALLSKETPNYHLVINADVYFNPGVLEYLYDFMEANPQIGHVMPLVKNPDGSNQFLCKLLPSPIDLFINLISNFSLKFKMKSKFKLIEKAYNNICFIPYLSGCFMYLRTDIIKKIGGFDERFFLYAEDIDLTRRIAEISETVCNPKVEVFHKHGRHTYKDWKMFLIHAYNVCKYFNKWGWFFDAKMNELNKKTLNQFLD